MNNAIIIAREIQRANPKGLRSLFLRYNIGAEVTPQNTVLATIAFGDAFTEDLYRLYTGRNYTGVSTTGLSTIESGLLNYDNSLIFGSDYTAQKFDLNGNSVSSTSATKKTGLDSFKDIFSSVADIIGTGVNTYNAIKTGKTVQTTEQQQADQQLLALQTQQELAAADAKTRQIYIVGGVLIALLFVGIWIFKKK